MSLIGLIVMIIAVGVILWATRALLGAFSVGEPISTVILVLVIVVCLLWVLNQFGIFTAGPVIRLK